RVAFLYHTNDIRFGHVAVFRFENHLKEPVYIFEGLMESRREDGRVQEVEVPRYQIVATLEVPGSSTPILSVPSSTTAEFRVSVPADDKVRRLVVGCVPEGRFRQVVTRGPFRRILAQVGFPPWIQRKLDGWFCPASQFFKMGPPNTSLEPTA